MDTPTNSLAPPDRCAECGFRSDAVTTANAEEAVRSLGYRYEEALSPGAGDDLAARLRRRPDPQTWSALEYAAHVRDVIALWGGALHRALTEDRPRLARPDPALADRTASERSYNSERPSAVIEELSANAARMARKVATIEEAGWDRAAFLGDVEMTALSIVRKVAHEGHHHLVDIGRSLAAATTDG